jgi:hypothetical protein
MVKPIANAIAHLEARVAALECYNTIRPMHEEAARDRKPAAKTVSDSADLVTTKRFEEAAAAMKRIADSGTTMPSPEKPTAAIRNVTTQL